MKIIFSTVIAVVLLSIYVYLVWFGIDIIQCIEDSSCEKLLTEVDFTERMASTLTLISGLVSALVIAELSITMPGEVPAARLMSKDSSVLTKNIVQIVIGLYLVIWLITGLMAFIFGYLTAQPGSMIALANLGHSWFGIAVGAGYAYFGIKPKENKVT